MSEKLRLQEPIRSPLETPRLITPLPYRSGTSFLAWAIVNNKQPVPDVFSKMPKIAASGRLGLYGCTAKWDAKTQTCKGKWLPLYEQQPCFSTGHRFRSSSSATSSNTSERYTSPQP